MTGIGDPIGLPGLAAIVAALFLFFAALLVTRQRRGVENGATATRSGRSLLGIAVQALGFGVATAGPLDVSLDPLSAAALVPAAVIAVLATLSIGVFFWSSQTMGRNWSLVARTRDDHVLVTRGPFAYVRHPIYVALFAFMIALAIAFGHVSRLWLATAFYGVGTWLRVREEERLLRAMFGAAYDAYAARVSRFVPGLF